MVRAAIALGTVALLLVSAFTVPTAGAAPSRTPAADHATPTARSPNRAAEPGRAAVEPSSPPPAPNWLNLTPNLTVVPSARTFVQFAWDPALGGDILFGGYDEGVFADGDTWEFANGNWTDLTPNLTIAPPGRWGGGFLWDPALNALLLFGGRGVSTTYNDTWEFNASGWTNLNLAVSPSIRQNFDIDFDPNLGGVYLYGGICRLCNPSNLPHYSDSWEFANGGWTNITTKVANAPSSISFLTYDPVDGYTLGFGSGTTACVGQNTTYAFNGTAWRTLPIAHAPGFSAGDGIVYDSDLHRLVLVGGNTAVNGGVDCADYPATWTYAGGVWTNVTGSLATSPGDRFATEVVFDGSEGVVLEEGGARYFPRPYGYYSADLWSYPYLPFSANGTVRNYLHAAPLQVAERATYRGGTSGPVLVVWDWGDGSPNSTTLSAVHNYTVPGLYELHLTATDSGGQTATWSLRVDVLSAVSATIQTPAARGLAPFTTQFTATGSGGTGAPYTYTWSFDDGTPSSSGTTVYHTFTQPGTYTVNVETADSTGELGNSTQVIHAVAPLRLVDAFANVTTGPAPLTVGFSADLSGGLPAFELRWAFSDGGQAITQNTSHVFSQPGTFTADFSAVDSLGEQVTKELTVRPYLALSVRVTAAPTSLEVGFPVNFTASVSGGDGGDSFNWSGLPTNCTSANSPFLICSPAGAGNFTVTVLVTDTAHDSAAGSAKVVVTTIPVAHPVPPVTTSSSVPLTLLLAVGIAIAVPVVVGVVLLRRRPPPAT